MSDIWVISDTHFHHANILRFVDKDGELVRGGRFSTIEEMDETILENWNSVVKPGDIVYHLGDVMMGEQQHFIKFWRRLNGKKRLILGNHDDAKFFAKHELVSKILMWRMFPEFGLVLSHVPMHNDSLWRYPTKDNPDMEKVPLLNIHGHLHQNPSPTEQHCNVCVEHINYTPVNIEELRIT